jgi:hypothetical protein
MKYQEKKFDAVHKDKNRALSEDEWFRQQFD